MKEAIILIAILAGLLIVALLHDSESYARKAEFAAKCESMGGFVVDTDTGFITVKSQCVIR